METCKFCFSESEFVSFSSLLFTFVIFSLLSLLGNSKLASMPAGGAAPAAAAAGGGAAAGGEEKEEKKEEAKKEESESESDDDMGFGLFD